MKKIPKFVWVLIALAGLYGGAKMAWDIAYPSGTMRYKMTVAVETPEGTKVGSAVREVAFSSEPRIVPDVAGFNAGVSKGEAVVVDLGKRGVLFALMTGAIGPDYNYQVVLDAFPPPNEPGNECCHLNAEAIRYYRSLKTGKATLTPEQYPIFVRFRDPKDPKTVENIYETEYINMDERNKNGHIYHREQFHVKADHFEEMFGAGVKLKEVTMEVTDEPVTQSVRRFMPSYQNQQEYMKWFNSLPYGDPRKIGPYDFTTGDKK